MTDDRALKQAVRRRMEQTGEKYTEARRALLAAEALRDPRMGTWTPGGQSVVLAESDGGGWPWVLEASGTERAGEPRVSYTVRRRDRKQASWSLVQPGDLPVGAMFFQDSEGDASVLCGPVADEVDTVMVEPVFPLRGPVQHAAIVSAEGLGRFFVIAFEQGVEQARVRVEPAGRFSAPERVGYNVKLRYRRQIADGVELGRGPTPPTPSGGRWRLRYWRSRPDERHVDLSIAADDDGIERWDQMEMPGGGYGGPPPAAGQMLVVGTVGQGGEVDHHDVVGEIDPSVRRVAIRLDDGSERDAHLVRTDSLDTDYFVAFYPPARHVVGVAALNENDDVLGHQPVPLERLGDERPPTDS